MGKSAGAFSWFVPAWAAGIAWPCQPANSCLPSCPGQKSGLTSLGSWHRDADQPAPDDILFARRQADQQLTLQNGNAAPAFRQQGQAAFGQLQLLDAPVDGMGLACHRFRPQQIGDDGADGLRGLEYQPGD